MRIRKGDSVIVLSGKNKGQTGNVTQVLPKKDKVVVEGLNMMKRHTKPSAQNPQGGIVESEAPLHVSNVALVDKDSNKPTRVGYSIIDGKKTRVSKRSGKEI